MTSLSIEPAYLDKAAAATFLALSESTLEKLVRNGELPAPRSISGKRVAWLVGKLREWAEKRPISSQLPPPNTGARCKNKTFMATTNSN